MDDRQPVADDLDRSRDRTEHHTRDDAPADGTSRLCRLTTSPPEPRGPTATTGPRTSRSWRASTRSASARACTSAPPAWPACTTSSGRSSTTPVDEAMAGYCTRIVVTLLADGGCRVDDNGRGIPIDPYPSGPHKGKSAAEVVLTVLHAGGKFGGGGYKVSGGLHGVGVSVVNALSERLIVEVDRDGQRYRQEYAKGGKPQGKMELVGPTPGRGRTSGTIVTFWPDPTHLRGRGHRVRHPHGPRAAADDGLPQPRPRDRVRRRAGREGADGHLPVPRWPRRLREAPQRLQGGAVLEGLPVRGRGRGQPGPRHRHPVEHRLLRGHPRLRQRHLHHRGRDARRGLPQPR